jgi:hypothetical protein
LRTLPERMRLWNPALWERLSSSSDGFGIDICVADQRCASAACRFGESQN